MNLLRKTVLASCCSVLSLGVLAGCGDTSRGGDDDNANRRIAGVILLDDMNDGNTQTLENNLGYTGFWFTYSDTEECQACGEPMCMGTMTPVEGEEFVMDPTVQAGYATPDVEAELTADEGDRLSAHMAGENFYLWGAGMGFAFNSDVAYDLTAAEADIGEPVVGIRFLAVTGNDTGAEALHVKVHSVPTDPTGMLCIQGEETPPGCFPNQGCYASFETVVTIDSTWNEYQVLFDNLAIPSWAGADRWNGGQIPQSLDKTQLLQLQFQVERNEAASGAPFDVWVDNVGFLLQSGVGGPSSPAPDGSAGGPGGGGGGAGGMDDPGPADGGMGGDSQ